MRIDKYLKVSRLIKRRPLAKEIVDKGRVKVNDKVVKAGNSVKVNDIIEIKYGNRMTKVKVLDIKDTTKKDEASSLYEIIEEVRTTDNILS